MNIRIQVFPDFYIHIDVNETDTVEQFKIYVYNRLKIEPKNQYYVFNDLPFIDERELRDYGMYDNCSINLIKI